MQTISTPIACAIIGCVLAVALSPPCLAENEVAGELVVLNDNGAWSWFEDERAICDPTSGLIVVSSVASGKGPGGIDRDGDVEVAALDTTRGTVSRFMLSDALEADDHDSAALWRRPDGRYLAVYSKHNRDPLTRYRISTSPGQIDSWSDERTFTNSGKTTYSNLLHLSNDGGAARLYNFTRTAQLDPHFTTSGNNGESWRARGRLLDWPIPRGDRRFTGKDGGRPYLKYATNGIDEIHFIVSDDHPRAYNNSLYHGIIRNGKLYNASGEVLDADMSDEHAVAPNRLAKVFDAEKSLFAHAWAVDLHLDQGGRPYAVFVVRARHDMFQDHRFMFARFDGSRWTVNEIAKAGPYLYAGELDYTGLAALDPESPNRIFISTPIDPRTQAQLPHYEIFEGTTQDAGSSWRWRPVTFHSTVDNLRPIVPKWDGQRTALLWMRGEYFTFKSFDTQIVALTDIRPELNAQNTDVIAVPPAPRTYKGREIAETMHFLGAPWLTRESREREEECSLMLEALAVQPGDVVCDMGCGNGFYTIKLARLVGDNGKVIAVDIQREMLELLKDRASEEKVTNIDTKLGTIVDPKLPANSLDLVLLVDVYHEFSHPEQMLAAIRKSLKPKGRVALVEFRSEDPNVPIKPLHKMSKEQILKELPPNGFKLVEEFDKLPWQHLMFFERDDGAKGPATRTGKREGTD